MRLGAVSPNYQTAAFKGATFTTSTKNNGNYDEESTLQPFRDNFQDNIAKQKECKDFDSIKANTEMYSLGAGKGSRFSEMAEFQNPQANKISFGMPLVNGSYFHMSDPALALGVPFADGKGVKRKNAEVARGTFAEIVDDAQKLRDAGKPQKNVIVCCGDNLFHTDKKFELNYFMKDVINNPAKQMGLVGVEREPEEVVKKFGVLNVVPTDRDDVMQLDGFVEKPKTIEIAREFETPNGKCIANTGMFVIKAEAMEWLMDELEKDSMFIAKDENEPYDFAAACQKVQEKYGKEKCDVKLVQTWEDAGEPKALYNTIKEMQKGKFLTNFAKDDQKMIQESMKRIFDGKTLLASQAALNEYGTASNYTESDALILPKGIDVKNVDGVNVVV